MNLSDEQKAYDQRQLKLIHQRLNFCKNRTIQDDVSADLIGLCHLLNDISVKWKETFLLLSNKLDHIYDIASYENRNELTPEEQAESKKIVAELKNMVEPLIDIENN